MKNKIVLFSVLTVFALFAMIAVPSVSATANAIYLNPVDSNGLYCENDTLVEVRVNANVVTTGVQTDIYFDPTCVDITDVDYTGSAWPPFAPPGWTHWGDHVTLIGIDMAGVPAGDNLFATIRLHCVNEDNCVSGLELSGVIVLDQTSAPIDITAYEGTFSCEIPEKPDLNVTSININPNCSSVVDEIFVNENNEICAVIHNDGPGDVLANESFDVCFDANGVSISCVTVTGPLEAGNNVTVCINWTPSCADYPVMPVYPVTPVAVTLTVTADCNCTGCPICPPGGRIDEVDEYNNILSKDTFVYNKGYKSKNFDCNLPEEPLTLFEEDQFYGGVVYNVSGTKNYPFDPDETDTRVHHIDIPAGMTVQKARLYVYWYDYWGNPPPGCLADLSVNFSNTIVPLDAAYTDQKGFGTYNTPKGTYAYDVTPQVTAGSNDYTVIVTNIDPTNQTTLLGEMLLVVYEDPGKLQNHIHLWIMEGCDYLMASHGTYQYCVDVNEATATVTFPGPIPSAVTGAKLITVVSQGLADGANKLFNGNIVHTNAWNDMPVSKISVDEEVLDVSQLAPADNTVGFQDTGTNGMQASNAILILEKSKQNPLWHEINEELDALITNVSAANMPNIIKQRLIDKLEYAKRLKDNAKMVCEEGNFDGATKKLGVAKSQVESFASMVRITRRISAADKASFLADSTEIKGEIEALIEYIETEHKC